MNQIGQGAMCTRRRFLSACAACAGCAASGTLGEPRRLWAKAPAGGKPRIRLVFCETKNDKPIWPNIGYDFDARRRRMSELLIGGCPEVQFLPVQVMDDPKQAAEVVQLDSEVEGYLVCVQGLGWQNDISKLCATGKPTLLVDNLFGGSGLFLSRLPQIMSSGQPVDWISSSNDQDVVAAARNFALLRDGKSASQVAAAFRATRRKHTPQQSDWSCTHDPLPLPDFAKAFKQLRDTKILVVGGGWGGDAFRTAAQQLTGVQFVSIAFEEMAAAYAQAGKNAAGAFADRWMKEAKRVVEPSRAEIEKAGGMYVGMKQLLDKHGARGISVNCLGGFYGGHLQAYPCLGFSQLNNDGLIGGCEADQMSALTMAVMGALTGRPGYISDPVIDTSKNQIIYAHCVATTRPFGPEKASCPYDLRSHSEDRKGAVVQALLPEGYLTTTLELNPTTKQMLMHQAKSAGNNPSDLACRTKLEGIVKGDVEKLAEHWAMGWHRVTFYGDLTPHVTELVRAAED